MYRIEQNGNVWQVFDGSGNQLGADHNTYDDALAAIERELGVPRPNFISVAVFLAALWRGTAEAGT